MLKPPNMSPSFDQRHQNVLNQLNADTINLYIGEQTAVQTKQWRNLESVNYGVIRDNENARVIFSNDLFTSLREAFHLQSYKRFNALLHIDAVRAANGEEVPIYVLDCHEVGLAAALRKRRKKRIEEIVAIRQNPSIDAAEQRKRLIESAQREEETWEGWSRRAQIIYSRTYSPLEIVYDVQASRIAVDSISDFSLDPADYTNHLGTTSELLRYVAATTNLSIGVMGDIKWTKDFRLLKVMIDVLDHRRVDLDRIRVDVSNFEVWDYVNLDFERELFEHAGL
jgi:hypothetical protein